MNFIAEKNISGLREVRYRAEYGETVPVSYRKISLWYREAKEGEALSQYNLGVMYFSGRGIEQNFLKASEWFKKAAVRGDKRAQFRLGHMYFYGKGVDRNLFLASMWFRRSSE
jgi:uncharacterized protein